MFILRKLSMSLAVAAVAMIGPAYAAETTISVSGDSVPSDCGAAKSANAGSELSGDLTGCLAIFVQHFNCRERNGFAFSTELGREEFEGALHGKPITFNTTYIFEAIWPAGSCPAPAVESEVAGGCTHYVSGENVQGLIRFFDVIPTVGKGATNFFYEGVLNISDAGTAATTPVAPRPDPVAVADAAVPRTTTQSLALAC